MSLADDEDFAETVQGEPAFDDELDDDASPPARLPPPPASADVTFIASFEGPAKAEPVARSLPHTIEMEDGAASVQGSGDEYGATVLDGFSREPEKPILAPSAVGPQSRPLGPPPPQSDAPLYAALAAIIVLVVGLIIVIIASVLA